MLIYTEGKKKRTLCLGVYFGAIYSRKLKKSKITPLDSFNSVSISEKNISKTLWCLQITVCSKHQPQIQTSQSSISFVATMNKNQDMATVAHLHNNSAKHILWNISRHFESTAYGSSFTFSGGETLSLILLLSSPKCVLLEQCLMKWQTNRVHWNCKQIEIALAYDAPSERLPSLVVWVLDHPLSGGSWQYWNRACVWKEAETSKIRYKKERIKMLQIFKFCLNVAWNYVFTYPWAPSVRMAVSEAEWNRFQSGVTAVLTSGLLVVRSWQ